jgi:hypothetical protein
MAALIGSGFQCLFSGIISPSKIKKARSNEVESNGKFRSRE